MSENYTKRDLLAILYTTTFFVLVMVGLYYLDLHFQILDQVAKCFLP